MRNDKVINTIRGQIYEMLKDRICDGEYEPGQWLQEKELAEQFAVSRSPVREALRQLASEGYLVDVPNKGMFVRVLTERDLEEIYDMRVLLENHALGLAVSRVKEEDEKKMRGYLKIMDAAYHAGDMAQFIELDKKLHDYFCYLSGHSLLISTYERLCGSFHQFRVYSLLDSERQAGSNAEHRGIVHSLLAGDVEQAQAINREHLRLAKEQILVNLMNKKPEAEG